MYRALLNCCICDWVYRLSQSRLEQFSIEQLDNTCIYYGQLHKVRCTDQDLITPMLPVIASLCKWNCSHCDYTKSCLLIDSSRTSTFVTTCYSNIGSWVYSLWLVHISVLSLRTVCHESKWRTMNNLGTSLVQILSNST